MPDLGGFPLLSFIVSPMSYFTVMTKIRIQPAEFGYRVVEIGWDGRNMAEKVQNTKYFCSELNI